MKDFVETDMTDHEFAGYLRRVDPNWNYYHVSKYTKFLGNGTVIAVVKYKNDLPLARKIWIKKEYLRTRREK